MSLEAKRKKIDRVLAQYQSARETKRREAKAFVAAENTYTDAQAAQGIIADVAAAVQAQAHQRIASVVTKCLQTVFGDGAYTFRIDFERKQGRTEASLVFLRDGLAVDPLSSAGGGVVDVAAFALRLACLMLSHPPKRRLLVMDEPFKFLSAAYRDAAREMLLTLAEEMKVQFIIVSHIEEFQCGHTVEIE